MSVVNLNKFKKQKARAEKEIRAQNNRVKFGTPKHLKSKVKAENLLEQKRLESKKLESENSPSSSEALGHIAPPSSSEAVGHQK
jgi:Domain of unknown function (DUF4169)